MTTDVPLSQLARHGAFVALFNTVVTGVLLLTGSRGWDIQFVYAQAIGMSIWACMDFGRFFLFPNRETRWPRGRWGVVLVVVALLFGYVVGTTIGDYYCGCNTWSMTGMDRHGLVTSLLATIIAGGVGTGYFYSRGRAHYMKAHAAATAQALAEARLKLLESQLEPHILFNTLANLRVLIALDPDRAQAMLDRLIAFLRATLAGSRGSVHSLADEFARVADYLELMKIRMGERLRTHVDLPAALSELRVPPLLLQPLVENAIKHGLEANIDGGLIDVSAVADGDSLVLRVRDTGAGLDSGSLPLADSSVASNGDGPAAITGSRFGLSQVRERLATLYGPRAAFSLETLPDDEAGGGGTLATVRIPLDACRPAAAVESQQNAGASDCTPSMSQPASKRPGPEAAR
ncbi:hypothetical protein BH09PSE5_BH09PSE5_35250 [soil metagenome]